MRRFHFFLFLFLFVSACSTSPQPLRGAPSTTETSAVTDETPTTTTETPAVTDENPTTTTETTTTDAPTTTTASTEGTLGDPVLLGNGFTFSDNWSLLVTTVNFDAWAEIKEANMFNDPPDDGSTYVLIEVTLVYNGTEDPANPWFDVEFGAVGQSGVGYEECDFTVLPEELSNSLDVFSGGALKGNICFMVTNEDINNLTLYVSEFSFFEEDANVYFSLTAESETPTGIETILGPVPGANSTPARLSPYPIDSWVSIEGGWKLKVNESTPDATDLVLAENMFNEPPKDGHVFFLVNVSLENESNDIQDGFWGDIKAVGDGNVELDPYGCGVVPNELYNYVDVFPGGSIEGNICFEVPVSELDAEIVIYATGDFIQDEGAITFATR
tara:strand:+ start:106 stop:1263 length:1158 start_codon:yes stop_codon:yes gene_type:complete